MITNEAAYEMGKQAGCSMYSVKPGGRMTKKQAALQKAAFAGRLAALGLGGLALGPGGLWNKTIHPAINRSLGFKNTQGGGGGGMYGTGGGAADKQFQTLYGMPVADFRKQMQAKNQLVNAMSMNQMFSLPAMMRGGFGGGQPNYGGGGFQRTGY